MVDSNRLEKVAAFERIKFLCLLYFCDCKFLELWGEIYHYVIVRKDFEVLRAGSIQYIGCQVFQREIVYMSAAGFMIMEWYPHLC